jgi:hypothetical protein
METKFDELMYHSGLTAQGCWDEMDDYMREAINRYANLLVAECARCALANDDLFTSQDIFKHFGLDK